MDSEKFFDAMAHPLRRNIIRLLELNGRMTYTELLESLRLSETSRLSFHLKKMELLLSQDEEKRYLFSELGKKSSLIISEMESPPSPSRSFTGSRIASFPKRLAAYFVDAGFVSIVLLLAGADRYGSPYSADLSVSIAFLTTESLILWIYLTLFEGYKGQTLGKLILGLRVKRADGRDITYPDAAIRNFAKSFSVLLPFDMLLGMKKKGYIRYFDWFTGTTVVEE